MPPMNPDPKGYYARLGIPPGAAGDAITAAFRRRARVVHPDVPGTGDAAAFVALKAAYDVLADPLQRAAYDRSGRPASPPAWMTEPSSTAAPAPRSSRLDLTLSIWVGLLGVATVVVVAVMLRLAGAPEPTAPRHLQAPPAARRLPPAPVRLAGTPNHYVAPGAGSATLWRMAAGIGNRLVPAGRIPPFTVVHALGLIADRGLMAVALAGGEVGYLDAARLVPGDAAAARQAFCTDQAGAPPGNAELLARRGGGGSARLLIRNRGEEPAVVKLRDRNGRTEASVFVAPGMPVTVIGLPDGPWQADVAVGEVWSRACGLFAAGMRAQRLGRIQPGSELTVPAELSDGVAPVDIPDQTFAGD